MPKFSKKGKERELHSSQIFPFLEEDGSCIAAIFFHLWMIQGAVPLENFTINVKRELGKLW